MTEAPARVILVVDDASVDRKLAAKCLEREGHKYCLAYDGMQALQMLRSQAIDLVLIDLNMPVMNGFETLQQIKASPLLKHIPVILMSSDDGRSAGSPGTPPNLIRAIEMGAEDFLMKPFSQKELKEKVENVFRPKAAQDAAVVNILCVDDQSVIRRIVSKCLTKHGFNVEVAEDGVVAFEKLEAIQDRIRSGDRAVQPVDLILLDIVMPRMDGKSVLVRLKDSAEWRDIPVIVMTSNEEEETSGEMLVLGAEDCLRKPLTDSMLRMRINKVLESRRLRHWVAKQWALAQKPASPPMSPTSPGDTVLARNPVGVSPASPPPPPFPSSPPTPSGRLIAGLTTSSSGGSSGGGSASASGVTSSSTGTTPSVTSTPSQSSTSRAALDALRRDNKLYLRIVHEKQAKILQLENALTTLQRDVISLEEEKKSNIRQRQALLDLNRDLRVTVMQLQDRLRTLTGEMSERDFVPSIVHPNKLNGVLMDEVEEVHMRAHILFSSCPGGVMTVVGEELAKLANEVCGYPTYFARPLFDRMLQFRVESGRDEPDVKSGSTMQGITFDDFAAYWRALVDCNLTSRIGRFWFLVKPLHRPYIVPEDLHPVIRALVYYHPDLVGLRDSAFHLNAYVSTVAISVFCSLHGQGTTRITLGEMKGSNLVDAFELVATQTTRNVRPFCIAYFDEIFSSFLKCVRPGTELVYMEDGLADAKITPGVLKRVFGHFPRHLKSTVPGTFTFEDFVFFYLADKDRMTDTSVLYWFRCLDIDGDGFLGKSDLETCYEMKLEALREIGAPDAMGSITPFDALCQITDVIHPAIPGRITCMDITRSNSGPVVFDVLITVAGGPASVNYLV